MASAAPGLVQTKCKTLLQRFGDKIWWSLAILKNKRQKPFLHMHVYVCVCMRALHVADSVGVANVGVMMRRGRCPLTQRDPSSHVTTRSTLFLGGLLRESALRGFTAPRINTNPWRCGDSPGDRNGGTAHPASSAQHKRHSATVCQR